MRNHSNIETRKFVGHDYYVGYGFDGAIYHIRRLSDRSWYAWSTAINGFAMTVREHGTAYAAQNADTSMVRQIEER